MGRTRTPYLKPLTSPEEAFCLHYFQNGDQNAALRASHDCSKITDKSVVEAASRMLRRPHIRLRLEQLRDAAAALAVVNEAEVLRGCAHIAFSDPLGVVDKEGHLRKLSDMAPQVRAAVAAIEFEDIKVEILDKDGNATGKVKRTTRVKRVKFWDKNSAQDRLMKHLGMYERDNVQRKGLFDGVPAAEAKRVMERISDIENRRPALAGNSQPGHAKSPLH